MRIPIRTLRALAFCVLAFLIVSPFYASAANLPTGFAESRLAIGLDPTSMEFAPDGRLFITEKAGRVRIVKNGVLLATPFLTLTVNNDNERGLQTLIFDPQFATNKYVYVYYTAASPTIHNRVSRFTANGDVAVVSSEVVLFDLPILGAGNHNGGALRISGGKLFITTGENAVPSNAQSFTTTLGKVLRINLDGSIPSDNPYYASTTGNNRAIYALGFRNPYKMCIRPATGDLIINDVGQDTWEEVNVLAAGKNYGWPTIEGKRTTQTAPANYQDPFYVYNHNNGCAITGGNFYNPATGNFPSSFTGKYLFTDYCYNFIKTLDFATGTEANFARNITSPVDVKVGPDGYVYYLMRGNSNTNDYSLNGELWQIKYTASDVPTFSYQPASQTVAVGTSVTFSAGANGQDLTFQWQRNGVDIAGATDNTFNQSSYTFTAAAGDNGAQYRVVITNASGTATSQAATLTLTGVTNHPPVAKITSPADSSLYRAGTRIQLTGTGTDQDETLAASAYSWVVVFHHLMHTHPGPTVTKAADGKSGYFDIPNSGETSYMVWYRVFLTVRDSRGATSVDSIDLDPRVATISVVTNPPKKLQIALDGINHTAPYSQKFVSGMRIALSAPATQQKGDTTYTLTGWAPGPDSSGYITVTDANKLYAANYTTAVSITSGGTYFIVPKGSGKYLSVAGQATGNGALLAPATPNQADASQQWVLRQDGAGYYTIQNVRAGKNIDIKGPTRLDNAPAQLWAANGAQNQEFSLTPVTGTSLYKIVSRYSAKCLELTTTSPAVQQRTCSAADAQQYGLVRYGTSISREGLDELAADNILVYPNPAHSTLTIGNAEGAPFSILDATGRQVYAGQATSAMHQLNLAVPTGLYIVRIYLPTGTVERRIAVE